MNRILATLTIGFLLLSITPWGAGVSRAQGTSGHPPTIPVEDLRPGMEGYGLTVFEGTEPERFAVRILGVLPNRWPGTSMILAEVDHPALENIGVAAGMSGSPVYIDDKLIGAVGYGWAYSSKPIAGITPIHKMLEVLDMTTDEPQLPPAEWISGIPHWPEAREALGWGTGESHEQTFEVPIDALRGMGVAGLGEATGQARFKPLAPPVMISSADPVVLRHAERLLRGSSLHPVSGGASGSALNDPRYVGLEHQAGGALATLYIDGDLTMAGIATTTYVEEDRLVGVAHSMNGFGAVDAPMAVAEVTTVLPSLMFPFKMGYPVKELGALRQDRQFGLGGTLLSNSPMTPISVNVYQETHGEEYEFNFRAWRHRYFLPGLTYICVVQSLATSGTFDGPMSVEIDYTIALSNGREVRRKDFYSGDFLMNQTASVEVATLIDRIQNNRFEPLDIESFHADLRIREVQQIMVLEKIERGKRRLYPGETVRADLQYARWREARSSIPIEVTLPRDIAPGDYQLYVVDGRSRREMEFTFRPELNRIESLDDILERTEPSFPSDSIYVLLVEPVQRVTLGRQPMEALPSTIAQITDATARDPNLTLRTTGKLLKEQRIPFEALVAGSVSIPITVLDR